MSDPPWVVIVVFGRPVLAQPAKATAASSDEDTTVACGLVCDEDGPVPGLVRGDPLANERVGETMTVRRDPRLEVHVAQSCSIGWPCGPNQHGIESLSPFGALTNHELGVVEVREQFR